MKTLLSALILLLSIHTAFAQDMHQEVQYKCNDTVTYTATEYPARLTIDQEELRLSILKDLVLKPEDMKVFGKYTYRFTVDCHGKNINSRVECKEGPDGISLRILKLLDEKCTWEPGIEKEQPVTTFYYLTVIFNKGNVDVVKQRTR